MEKQDETISVNIDPQTLPASWLDFRGIAEAADMTPPVRKSSSPYYKNLVDKEVFECSSPYYKNLVDKEVTKSSSLWDTLFSEWKVGHHVPATNIAEEVVGDLPVRACHFKRRSNHNMTFMDHIRHYKRVFKHFDENEDGKISSAELRQCMDAIGEKKLSGEDAEMAVSCLDTDGDGLGGKEEDKVNDLKDAFKINERNDDLNPKVVGGGLLEKIAWMDGMKYRETNWLQVSQNVLKNALLEQKSLNCKPFLRFLIESVLDIPPQERGILLMSCGSILTYLARNSTTPFDDFQVGKTSKNKPHLLLSFGEAFKVFFPEMAHTTMFMICYILAWMLVLPLRPAGVQIFLVILLTYTPLLYFPDLVHKGSTLGVDVAFGNSFKLPLIGFSTLGAFAICLIFGLVVLLLFYMIWRFIHGRTPTRGKDIEVNPDGLLSMISNV